MYGAGRPELLGPWLANRGRFEEAANLFSLEQAKQRPELFHSWLGVLMHRSPQNRAKRLKEAQQILTKAGGKIPEAQRVFWGAVLLRERGDQEGMRKLFDQALTESRNLPAEKRGSFLDTLARQSLASGEREWVTSGYVDRVSASYARNRVNRYIILITVI